MLVELAIGDAYGAGFEYASPHFVERYNTLAGYVAHPRHNLQPGAYTDDTQMSLALAEAIISGEPWTPNSWGWYPASYPPVRTMPSGVSGPGLSALFLPRYLQASASQS